MLDLCHRFLPGVDMSEVGGKSHSEGGGNFISLIDGIFRWCEALKGQAPLESAVKVIAEGIGAEAVAVSRVWQAGQGAAKYVVFDKLSGSSPLPRLDRSFAAAILGEFMTVVRTGTVWLRSSIEVDADPVLSLFHSRRAIRELAIIPLDTGENTSDFLEIHFPEQLTPKQHAMLNSLARTLSDAWRVRTKGVFVASLVEREEKPQETCGENLLGHDNPARFSRAEYRVCLLLSRGLPTKSICTELSISRSTLQTHLRNIYAKTSTHNLPDLLFVLLRGLQHPSPGNMRRIA